MMPDAPSIETTLAIFSMPGGTEWIVLLVIGLLLFGRRLPEVGRSLGKGIVEFKRGIKGIEDEIEQESSSAGAANPAQLQQQTSTPLPGSGVSTSAEEHVSRQDS